MLAILVFDLWHRLVRGGFIIIPPTFPPKTEVWHWNIVVWGEKKKWRNWIRINFHQVFMVILECLCWNNFIQGVERFYWCWIIVHILKKVGMICLHFFMIKVDYMLFSKVSSIQEKLNSISLLIRFAKMFLMTVIDLLSALPAIPSWQMCTIGKVAYLPCTWYVSWAS